jgi:4-hydroxybenzoate polyprenyltransferase
MEPSRLSRGSGGGTSWSAGLAAIVRAGEWWDHKLVPILVMFYATLLLLGRPIAASWTSAVALLLSVLAGAAYVSVVNDLTDLDEDRAADKSQPDGGKIPDFPCHRPAASVGNRSLLPSPVARRPLAGRRLSFGVDRFQPSIRCRPSASRREE